MKKWYLDSPEQTDQLGQALAATHPQSLCVWLVGSLGAGKSSLARAFIRGLGVEGTVRSPTYSLVERYPLQHGGECVHMDLYRIASVNELDFLGLDEIDPSNAIYLIEWPDQGRGHIPQPDLILELSLHQTGRAISLSAAKEHAALWFEAAVVQAKLQPIS